MLAILESLTISHLCRAHCYLAPNVLAIGLQLPARDARAQHGLSEDLAWAVVQGALGVVAHLWQEGQVSEHRPDRVAHVVHPDCTACSD